MARAQTSIFGKVSGRIGDVVGYVVNGEQRFRKRPGKRTGKPTYNQKAQQAKFAMAAKIERPFKQLFLETFTNKKRQITAMNSARSYILKNVVGRYPELSFDWTQFKICNGDFPADMTCEARIKTGKIIFTWDVKVLEIKGHNLPYEIPIVVAYFPEVAYCNFKIGGSDYEDGVSYLDIERLQDHKAYLYMAFASKDLRYKTESMYLGEVKVV